MHCCQACLSIILANLIILSAQRENNRAEAETKHDLKGITFYSNSS